MTASTTGNLDPLVSLHNMVHASAQIKQNSASEVPVITKQEPIEVEEEEEIIVDVETAEQSTTHDKPNGNGKK